jgi:hypothetical protein
MKADVKFDEQRRSPRRTAFMQASIVHPLKTEHLSCKVRDISQDGALLELPHAKDLPFSFWLHPEGDATLHFCTVAWRSDHHVGVEFSQQIIERFSVERWVSSKYGII